MTKDDTAIIKLALILILLTILFPPWKMNIALLSGSIEQSVSLTFSIIFFPPQGSRDGQIITGYSIDIPRLLMLWTAIVLVCGYLILIPRILKNNKPNEIKEIQNEV